MSTTLDFQNDVKGSNTFAPPFSTQVYTATLVAAAHSSITVPSNFKNWVAVFAYEPGATVWVSKNGTAAVPAGGTFAAAVSDLNPGARIVKAADVIDLITADATADVWVALYAIS